MNGYNFTERVRKVLMLAREEANKLNHEYVGTEHILLGLCEGGGVAEHALRSLGVDLVIVRANVLQLVTPGDANGKNTTESAAGGILGAIADTFGVGRTSSICPTQVAQRRRSNWQCRKPANSTTPTSAPNTSCSA